MILNDKNLWVAAQRGMVSPFREENLQGSSIDLTLGKHLKVENDNLAGPLWVDIEMTDAGYSLKPGEFCLAHTFETITIPDNCSAMVLLRSSAARAGFEHSLAGWCDPGFSGQLTLELRNNLRNRPLRLAPDMRLCQLVVHRMTDDAANPYSMKGNYQGQRGVTASTNNFSQEAA